MNAFKEWLSDYLRYFVLLLAVLLALGAIFLGVKLYQSTQTVEGDPDSVTIIEGTESETETETETEAETENMSETDTETSTEKVTEAETVTEKVTEKITEKETAVTEKKQEAGTSQTEKRQETTVPQTEKKRETAVSQTEPLIVINPSESQRQTEQRQTNPPQTEPPQTDPPETDPPEPVYLTMTGTCYFRSYADYGDNIIGEYPAGTVVEFLEDVGGWYKVQVDGMVGYMGAKFFN